MKILAQHPDLVSYTMNEEYQKVYGENLNITAADRQAVQNALANNNNPSSADGIFSAMLATQNMPTANGNIIKGTKDPQLALTILKKTMDFNPTNP